MKHTVRCEYAAPADRLLRMLTDRDFYPAKYRRLGVEKISVESFSDDGDTFSITTQREGRADPPPPDFAKRFVPDTVRLTHTECWDRLTRSGRAEIRFKGLPASIAITQRLEDTSDGTALVMEWDLKVSVPVLGRKLERLMLQTGLREIEREQRANAELLKAYF